MNAGEKFGFLTVLFCLFAIVLMHLPDHFSRSDWSLLTAAMIGAVIFVIWKTDQHD